MAHGELDRYVAGLSGALRGPRRVKADLLAEARDSLYDAAEAYRAMGLPPAEAARRAAAEFGEYADIAPAYQAELAVAQGRRTTLLIALGLAGVQLVTPLLSRLGTPSAAAGYAWLASGFRWLSVAGVALALLVRLGYGWGSRYIPDGVALTRTLGRAALAFLALHGLAGLAMYLWRLAQWPDALRSPVLWFGALALAAGFQYATLCAWRCLAVTR